MCMAFHLTFNSNLVNNNMFEYFIMFMFGKQCCNYKNINFYELDHAHICLSHENVMTELKFLWQNLKFF